LAPADAAPPNVVWALTMQIAGLRSSKGRRQIPTPRLRGAGRDRRRRLRALATKLDALLDNAVTSQDVSALKARVDIIIRAIDTSKAAGQVVPRDLEKLLIGFIHKLRRARVRRASRPYGFAQAASNVAVTVSLAFSLFVGLHIADRADLFDEIGSFLAEQVESLQSSWLSAESTQTEAEQALLQMPPLPTPPQAAVVGAGAGPSAVMPETTGALPPTDVARSAPPGPGRSVAIVEDKLPATIGNPALRAAALAGDPAAAYEVASRIAEGRGVAQSHVQEAHWLERAANQGLAPAQFRLAGLYEKGIGVGKDLTRARDLYLAAAQKGNANAMHNLAVLYAQGINGAPDYAAAAGWFRKAADHGIKDSQYNLAILFGRGIGVTQNYAESYKWFLLAADQGDGDAAIKRDEVAAYLDPQTREAARRATQSWSPKPQPDDAVNVKTQAAWETPAEMPHPPMPKPRPAGGDTRTAEGRLN
jgi:TPR repeat protein